MVKAISKEFKDGTKCGGCNWEATRKYSFTTNNIDKEGLCGDCFMDMLVEEKFEIKSVKG